MKYLIIIWLVFYSSIGIASLTQHKQLELCAQLQEISQKTCTEELCSEAWLQGEKCIHDGDFLEGFQICVQETFSLELSQYLQKHPSLTVNCAL